MRVNCTVERNAPKKPRISRNREVESNIYAPSVKAKQYLQDTDKSNTPRYSVWKKRNADDAFCRSVAGNTSSGHRRKHGLFMPFPEVFARAREQPTVRLQHRCSASSESEPEHVFRAELFDGGVVQCLSVFGRRNGQHRAPEAAAVHAAGALRTSLLAET